VRKKKKEAGVEGEKLGNQVIKVLRRFEPPGQAASGRIRGHGTKGIDFLSGRFLAWEARSKLAKQRRRKKILPWITGDHCEQKKTNWGTQKRLKKKEMAKPTVPLRKDKELQRKGEKRRGRNAE